MVKAKAQRGLTLLRNTKDRVAKHKCTNCGCTRYTPCGCINKEK